MIRGEVFCPGENVNKTASPWRTLQFSYADSYHAILNNVKCSIKHVCKIPVDIGLNCILIDIHALAYSS